MAQEKALVIDVLEGPHASTLARVRTQRQSTCNACQLKSSCGQHLVSKLVSGQGVELELSNQLGAKPGDVVVLSIPDQGLLKAAAIQFLLPLGLMLLFATCVGLLSDWPEPMLALSGFVGLVAGLGIARTMSKGLQNDPSFQPQMSEFALRGEQTTPCRDSDQIPLRNA